MRFRSEQGGLSPLAPRVLSIVLAATGLAYGLDGLLVGSVDGRTQTADRVFVVLVALCSAHLVWTLARMRRKKEREAEERADEHEPSQTPEHEQAAS